MERLFKACCPCARTNEMLGVQPRERTARRAAFVNAAAVSKAAAAADAASDSSSDSGTMDDDNDIDD